MSHKITPFSVKVAIKSVFISALQNNILLKQP